ncbi:MAG: hypothetical protein MZU91_10995 [Desulfosudis oleivorans]|nr:hypothetical protein [Desulfosudis oleivorans]
MVRSAFHRLRRDLRPGVLHAGHARRVRFHRIGDRKRPHRAHPGHRLRHGPARDRAGPARLPGDGDRSVPLPDRAGPGQGRGGRRRRSTSSSATPGASPSTAEFGLAVMICEGAFPLMETDEMNFEILRGAGQALRHGGKLVMTTLNGLFPLHRSVGQFESEGMVEAASAGHDFDLLTFRMRSRLETRDDQGRPIEVDCDERWYIPSELTWLLKQAGFGSVEVFGARLGAFSRSDALTPDDFEILAVAVRS